jgi:predicted ABC-type ATPase
MLLKHRAAFLCQQTGGQFCHGIGCNISPKRPAQSPGMPKKQVYDTATQEFFNQANEAVRLKQHFTLETNFRDKELVDIAAKFKQYGYTTNMVYLTLESVEESISRVKERVLDGGHFVDHKNILLNYNEGLQYLERFAGSFDKLAIINSSKDLGKFKSLLNIENKQLVYLSDDLPAGVRPIVINIANRYNSRGLNDDENRGPTRGRRR